MIVMRLLICRHRIVWMIGDLKTCLEMMITVKDRHIRTEIISNAIIATVMAILRIANVIKVTVLQTMVKIATKGIVSVLFTCIH